MSYYILPKNSNITNINPTCSDELCAPYISHSLINYYYLTKQQIINLVTNESNESNELNELNESNESNDYFDNAFKFINPYEFIFSKVPGSKYSVSKLKPNTNIFYDLFEISNNLNLFDSFKTDQPINFLHISPNYNDSIECFEMIRDNYIDKHIYVEKYDIDNNAKLTHKKDFLFYETNSFDYFMSLVQIIIIILRNQNLYGTSIIKIFDIFHKPTVDMLYILSSLYEKVYICKPNTNNILSFDRYIVCKNFLYDEQTNNNYLKLNYLKLTTFITNLEDKNISSMLDFDIPNYFKNKIDDLNIIIGQQNLDALDQIIAIYKNKNKNEKIEIIKKNNIQKSVSWCEKYKIPCNKFTEKINIFLPIIKKTTLPLET
jgi:hypothetical protein